MLALWTKMAKDAGFDGLTYIYQSAASSFDTSWDRSMFDYGVEMNPGYANLMFQNKRNGGFFPKLMKYSREIKRRLGIRRSLVPAGKPKSAGHMDYDAVWGNVLRLRPQPDGPRMIPCAFTDWDNTPRHKERGYLCDNVTPEKFHQYFSQLVKNARQYYDTDMIFVFAWNEWAEGGYLEPDEKHGYAFLEAIKDTLAKLK